MKIVRIYKPKLQKKKVKKYGKPVTITEVVDKKHELLMWGKEDQRKDTKGVMDRTFAPYGEYRGEELDELIVATNLYMEEVEEEPKKKKSGRPAKEKEEPKTEE